MVVVLFWWWVLLSTQVQLRCYLRCRLQGDRTISRTSGLWWLVVWSMVVDNGNNTNSDIVKTAEKCARLNSSQSTPVQKITVQCQWSLCGKFRLRSYLLYTNTTILCTSVLKIHYIYIRKGRPDFF